MKAVADLVSRVRAVPPESTAGGATASDSRETIESLRKCLAEVTIQRNLFRFQAEQAHASILIMMEEMRSLRSALARRRRA